MMFLFQVMDQPDLCGRTALMWAAARGACDMVRAMCRHGSDLGHQVSHSLLLPQREGTGISFQTFHHKFPKRGIH